MKYLSFLLFFVFSTLEVRVRASNPPLQKPANCYSSELGPCVFSSGNKILRLQNETLVLNLKENTTLERLGQKNFEFMNGTVWVQNEEPFQVQTLYGAIQSDKGEFWLIEKDSKVYVRSIIGTLKISLNSKNLEIPEGFQIWISGKDRGGKNIHGLPEVIPMEKHLKLWSELFTGTREEFKSKISMLKNLYKDNNNESSELYQKIADRHLASQAEQKRAEETAAERRRAYLQEIRRLYFEKVFER